MKLRHSLSGIEAFRCQTFVIRVTWIVSRRFVLPGSQTNCECIVAALTDASVKIVPPVRNNRGQCKVDQDIWERGPRLPIKIKIMSRRPATGSVISKGHRKRPFDCRALPVQLPSNGPQPVRRTYLSWYRPPVGALWASRVLHFGRASAG